MHRHHDRGDYLLLVEDNQDDIDLTLRALGKHQLANEVVVIRDGAEALDFLLARGQHADRQGARLPQLLLLDIKLPKLSGLEVLRALRSNPATQLLPVVILTSSREDRDVIESYARGANSYVQKPVSFEEFTEAVQQLGLYWLILNETTAADF
ncbi:MAG TPA: response regulator [Trueperaceae bacterium]